MKLKNCSICKKEFSAVSTLNKYCSFICAQKASENRGKSEKIKEKECVNCGLVFNTLLSRTKYCSRKCYFHSQKENRKGKNNPAYRNGTRTGGKTVTSKHLLATRKYGKAFIEKYGYKFCEVCKINQSLRFETHHIIFASEMPKHKELHNPKNLILVCIKCHNNFHSGKTKEKRLFLVKERRLTELFGDSIIK